MKHRFTHILGLLALIITGFLCAQWPLRELLGWEHIAANDFGQCCFSLFVVGSLGWVSARNGHLCLGYFSNNRTVKRMVEFIVFYFGLLPWLIVMTKDSTPKFIHSFLALEKFPETYSDYYWIIRLAIAILPVSILFGEAIRHYSKDREH